MNKIYKCIASPFEREIMHTQCCVQNKRLDFYFSEHKVGVEIAEYCHTGRDFE